MGRKFKTKSWYTRHRALNPQHSLHHIFGLRLVQIGLMEEIFGEEAEAVVLECRLQYDA